MSASVLGRRGCAVLAVTSAVLHGVLAADDVLSMLMAVAMGVVCLVCARELWIGPSTRTWAIVAAMNLVMIAMHLPAPGGHHGIGAMESSAHPSAVMGTATALAAVEVAAAAVVLYHRSRGQARVLIPQLAHPNMAQTS